MALDETIHRLTPRTLRRHPDLARWLSWLNVPAWDLLAYEATAEDAYGRVRFAALLPFSPFEGENPAVFALDGERRSLHRNPPFDDGKQGHSAHLCLYFERDPEERRWTAEYGLLELFDIARRHLLAEHIWRQTGNWPIGEAAHGEAARPARPRPELKVRPLRDTARQA